MKPAISARENELKHVGIWALTGFLAVLFFATGATKFFGASVHVESFTRWGYPEWFRYAVGFLELVGALLLVNRAAASFGASLLGGTMVGAVATHLAYGEAGQLAAPLALLVLLAVVGWVRRPDYLRKQGDSLNTSAKGV